MRDQSQSESAYGNEDLPNSAEVTRYPGQVWQGKIPDPDQVEMARQEFQNLSPHFAKEVANVRKILDQAGPIHITHGMGIGDNIMALRLARILSFGFPDKKFIFHTHPGLVRMSFLLPENCEMSVVEGEYPTKSIFLGSSLNEMVKFGQLLPQDHQYNFFDAYYVAQLQALGVEVTSEMLEAPLLNIPGELVMETPQDLDVLMVPDAADVETTKGDRSLKSFSVKQWADVLLQVPAGKKVGVVRGKIHPAYCEKVIEIAQLIALQNKFTVEVIDTETLQDFAVQVLRTQRFIGMDSGTSHLAYEVVRVAKHYGRDIQVREVFNNSIFRPEIFALRGMPEQVKVLLTQEEVKRRDGHDTAEMDIQKVADFAFDGWK